MFLREACKSVVCLVDELGHALAVQFAVVVAERLELLEVDLAVVVVIELFIGVVVAG